MMEDNSEEIKRLSLFKTLMKDFPVANVTSSELDSLENINENIAMSSEEYQSKVENILYEYLQKSIQNKCHLMEILLKLIKEEVTILHDSSVVYRCGCVIYTLFYKYMLDLNNIPRYGHHHSCNDARVEASFRKNLQNHALKEAIDAVTILDTALVIAVNGSSTCNQKCFFGFVPFYPKVACDMENQQFAKKVCEVVTIDYAKQYVATRVETVGESKHKKCFSLLNKSGGIRKGKVTKKTDVKKLVKKRKFEQSFVNEQMENEKDEDEKEEKGSCCNDEDDLPLNYVSVSASTNYMESFVMYNGKHFFTDGPPLDVYGSSNSARQHYEKERNVIIELKHYLTPQLLHYAHLIMLNKATKVRNSSQRPSKIRNNYRLEPSSDLPIRDDGRRIAYTVNYLDQYGENRLRCSDGQSKEDLLHFSHVIHWILNLVKDVLDGIIPDNVQACSSSGLLNSLHLIVALSNSLPQHFHYDYDLKKFDDSNFKASSMFINFRNEWTTLDIGVCEHNPKIRKQLRIPPMSVLVFRGDFKHAGSSNSHSTNETWKFFMYLDPFQEVGTFRKDNNNTLYYDRFDDLTYILWPDERELLRIQEKV